MEKNSSSPAVDVTADWTDMTDLCSALCSMTFAKERIRSVNVLLCTTRRVEGAW